MLLAAAAGATVPGSPPAGWAWSLRAAGILPVLFPLCGGRGRLLAWIAVALLAFWWGQGEAAGRRGRVAAVIAGPVAPAVAVRWEGFLALRTTGYATIAPDRSWRLPARVLAVGPGTGAPVPAPGEGIWLRGEGEAPLPGAPRRARVRLDVPPEAAIPGAFDLRLHLAARGLRWQGRELAAAPAPADFAARAGAAAARVRDRTARLLERLLPPREARLGAAVLLGLRTAQTRRDSADFTALGLAHLFAVSGLHVGILAGLVFAPLFLAGAGPGARLAAALPAIAGFVTLTGAPSSVVRAGSLVAVAAAAPVAGRKPRGLRLLGLVFWAVVIWEPQALLDSGARLSYLAAGGIIAANSATSGFRCRGGAVGRFLAAGLGVTAAAQWGTLPAVAGAFGRFNVWSVPVNMFVVPVFGVAVWLLAAAVVVAVACPWLGEGLAAWAWALLRLLEAGAASLGPRCAGGELGLPSPGPGQVAAWSVVTLVLVTALRSRTRVRVRTVTVVVGWGIGLTVFVGTGRTLPPRGAPLAIQFAVDQGDCGLVAFPDGWVALIDTGDAWQGGDGPLPRGVLPWLRRQGVDRLDAVILTHGHRDHTGGAAALGRGVEVARWYGGGRAGYTVATGPAPWARPGSAVGTLHAWRDWSLRLIDPVAAGTVRADADENDRSLVVVLRHGDRDAMVWTGDLETAGERGLLAAGLVPMGAEVWKAGHHGSDTSGSLEFLACLRPRHVLISCGVGNRYGHPSHGPYVVAGDTLGVLRTDLQGTLIIDWTTGSARPRPWRGRSP